MARKPQNLPAPARSQGHGGAREAVKNYLAKNVTLLAGLLPPGMDEKRMARIAMQCFKEIPALMTCSADSLIGGILAAAQVGLPIGKGAGGYAYLIPFSGQATLIIGVPGRIRLAYQSGHVKAARSGIVYAGQSFEADPVTGDIRIGMQDPEKDYDNEAGQWYWAAVETNLGGVVVDYMNRPTVETRRQKLRSKNSPAWRDHFDEMAQNMVLRRLLKRLPKSESQMRAEQVDARVVRHDHGSLVAEWVDTENGDQDKVITVEPAATPAEPADAAADDAPTLADEIEIWLGERPSGDLAKKVTHLMREAGLITTRQSWHEVDDVPLEAIWSALVSMRPEKSESAS